MTPTPDPLREALEAALDFGLSRAEGGGYIRSSGSLAVDVLRGLDLQGYALAQPAPALDAERLTAAAARLAPFLAIEFGKAGFFAPTASMEFLHAQATMMLADAVAEHASRETLDVP